MIKHLTEEPYWMTQLPVIQVGQTNRKRFEAAVIGAGYTGLSAAIRLANLGIDTVLIEQKVCGYGASGRNAGHLTPTIGKDIPTLLMMYGEAKTKELITFAERSVQFTESMIRDGKMTCNYLDSGNIMAAVTPGQTKRMCKSADTAIRLGLDMEWLDQSAMAEKGIPASFMSGIHEHVGGTLHPGMYLSCLKDLAIRKGVSIMENTFVLEYKKGRKLNIHTRNGIIEADKMVLATNGYRPLHKWIQRKTVPLTVTLMESAPLSDGELANLGWRNKEGIYTGHEILESYRLTTRNTIVAGSKIVTPRIDYREMDMPGKMDASIIRSAFDQRFPALNQLPTQSFWSGTICFTIDFLPIIKLLEDGVSTACAYAGHGIAAASYTGHIAADMLVEKQPRKHILSDRRVFTLPPNFILKPLVRLIIAVLQFFDKRADKEAKNEK